MFTGIVEELGEVTRAERRGDVVRVEIAARVVLEDLPLGGSVAVNGCCVTAVTVSSHAFGCELGPETLSRTAFEGRLLPGTLVNLERPMRADGRFGGHIVQGHVDGVGKIREFSRDGDNWTLRVDFPTPAIRYIVEKGSIAVDGISLTVAAVKSPTLDIAIIPHSLENTNLKRAAAGDTVNLEFDIIAKYVERMLNRDQS